MTCSIKPLATFLFAFGAMVALSCQAAEGPPASNGVISNPTLVANSAIAKAQAANAVTLFMSKGSQECDADGKNCKSLFGSDDSMDFNSVQLNTQSLTGVQSYSFASGNTADERMDSNTISTQTGTVVLACGDTAAKTVAGIAFRVTSCAVTAQGDAQMTFQVCTGPSRGNPVKPPEKVMKCSDDPASADFYPKLGYSCEKPSCETEPLNSLNGWSSPTTISFEQSVSESGSEDAKTKNGLGMVFYPALTGGTPSFSSDSDTMTAVKIVQTAVNESTKTSALGLRIAFRHKTKVTKEMMVQGTSSVLDPKSKTSAWETIEKLQGNALIPQYQATYSANGSECMQQIQNGLATDGVVSVCDQQYTNESGIKPGALTAQMATEGQNCGTTAQCLQEVVNTNTWSQTCSADVPLSIRKCTTTQDYETETLSYTRTRTKEECVEARTNSVESCATQAVLVGTRPASCPAGTVLVNTFTPNACSNCLDNWQTYRVTCQGNNQVHIRWYSAASNGAEYSAIVDRVVTVEPFASSTVYLPAFCFDGSGNVPFQTSCTANGCTYTAWITGNCNGAAFGLRASGYAEFTYEGVFNTVNACAAYEAASR